VKGDGTIQVKPIATEILSADGKKEFVYQFATQRQKERLRQGSTRKTS